MKTEEGLEILGQGAGNLGPRVDLRKIRTILQRAGVDRDIEQSLMIQDVRVDQNPILAGR